MSLSCVNSYLFDKIVYDMNFILSFICFGLNYFPILYAPVVEVSRGH